MKLIFYTTHLFSFIFRYFEINENNAAEWSLLSISFTPLTLSNDAITAGSSEPAIRIGWFPLTNTKIS